MSNSYSDIKVDFEVDGWDGFHKIPISRQAGTVNSLSVVNGRGRVTGIGPGASLRDALVHGGTSQWGATGIKSLWWGPSPAQTPTRSQVGHIHNVVQDGDRTYGVAFWHDTAFGVPGIMNVQRITFATDGTDANTATQTISSGRANVLTSLSRSGTVIRIERASNVARYRVFPTHIAYGVQVGDTFTVANAATAAFNVTDAVVTTVEPENGIITAANVGSAATEDCAPGVTYAPTVNYRGNLPYWVRTEVWGDTARIKTWAYGLPEPSWADPSCVLKTELQVNANYPEDVRARVAGRGASGIWAAHNHSNQYFEISDLEMYTL